MFSSNRPTNAAGADPLMPDVTSPIKLTGPGAQFLGVGIVGLGALIMLGAVVTGDDPSLALAVSVVGYGIALGVAQFALRRTYPHAAIGLCNAVTVVRLVLTCVVLAAVFASSPAAWPVFAIALTAFLLDGADGWLARREGYASNFGARFDVEVDAALALILAIYAHVHADVGAYVILLGLPRYLFIVAQYPLPWLSRQLPERFIRKVVCVAQISVLIAVLLPFVGTSLGGITVGVTALALMWSFAIDVRWLWMARP